VSDQLDLLRNFVGRGVAAQAAVGEALKPAGQAQVEGNNLAFVRELREEAIRLVRINGSVTAEELRAYAEVHGLEPTHPNAYGGVFRGPGWRVIGRRRSRWPSAHAREIKVWTYQLGSSGA